MKKTGRFLFYLLVGSFILIQFYQVDMNTSSKSTPHDFLQTAGDMPEGLPEVFKTSCYDCHSDNTIYPWYAYFAPFSWIINQHIQNGKAEMNFAHYDTLGKRQKIAFLNDLCEVVSDSSMPPQNYLILHRDAILTEDHVIAICDFADTEAMLLLRSDR